MSHDELESLIANAEEKLRQNASDDATSSTEQAVEGLKESGWPNALFTAPTALRLINLLRKLGNRQLAQEVLSTALTAHPHQAQFFNQQGYLYSEFKKYDQAFAWFLKTINKYPIAASTDLIDALVGAGAALRSLRRFDEAAEMFQQALDAQGRTASVALLVEQGWLCFYRKFYAEALALFQQAANQSLPNPQHEIHVGLLASRRQLDVLSPLASQDNARKLVSDWIEAGMPKAEVVRIFVDCSESVLEHLNLYPAALENAKHLLELEPNNHKGVYFQIAALKWLRRYREAATIYRQAPHNLQTNLQIWNERANSYYEQKRIREAYQHYSGKVFDDRPNLTREEETLREGLKTDLEAREWTIVSLRKMRRFDEARSAVNNALSVFDKKLNFISELAALHYAERDYDNAIKLFDRALELDDYDTFALQWRAASLRKKGKLDEAKAAIDEALKKVPYSTRLWDEYGWLAFDQGNFEEALKGFDKANELDPYLVNKQFAKVQTLLRLNRSDDALQVFKKLEQEFPHDAEVAEQLCWFYLQINQLELAGDQVVKLKRSHPHSALTLNALGGYEQAQRNYADAEKAFREAIAEVDYEPQYYVNLAWALMRQVKSPGELSRLEVPKRDKLIDEAKEHCRKALEIDRYNAKAYGCLGVIAFRQNAFLDAEFYFRKSIEINPIEGSYVELGSLYCQMGSYDKAVATLKKGLELNPGDAGAYIELGNVAVYKGDNKEAIQYCRQAVLVDPTNAETHRALAIALMRAAQYDEAELVVRKALRALASSKAWRLNLLLAQILVRNADDANKSSKKKDLDLYKEALGYVNQARQARSLNPDILFHLGIVQYRLEDLAPSHKSFDECLKLNRDHFDAERNSRIVKAAINQQRELFRINEMFSYILALICVIMLGLLWASYFKGDKRTVPAEPPAASATAANATAANATPASTPVTKDEFVVDRPTLTMLTPILLGLLAIAALLPNLSKLKLPGFEAEIADPKPADPNISTGPRGEIGFGTSLPIIDPEPR